jgi:hypothetical protein
MRTATAGAAAARFGKALRPAHLIEMALRFVCQTKRKAISPDFLEATAYG